jgi:hypothetical protein
MLAQESTEGLWSAWRLSVGSACDGDLERVLLEIAHELFAQTPDCELLVIDQSSVIHRRMAAIRGLFSAEHAPEVLDQGPEWQGFEAARGLHGQGLTGGSAWLELGAAVAAPLLFAIPLTRIQGSVVAIWPGLARGRRIEGEMIDNFNASLLSAPELTARGPSFMEPLFEAYTAQCGVVFLKWWVEQVNRLLSIALDPRHHVGANGDYDPASHLAFTLDLERLFSCVLSTLVLSGRGELPRRLAFFEALDLLEGLGQGGWDATLSASRLETAIDDLDAVIPLDGRPLVIPRCRDALDAVRRLHKGFYAKTRVSSDGIRLPSKKGGDETISFDNATSQYLRLIRNGGHTFRKTLSDPREMALLASHDGRLPASLSDIALVHLLRLVAEPWRLHPRTLHP